MNAARLAVALLMTLVSCGGGGDATSSDGVIIPACCKALPDPNEIGHSTVLAGSTGIAESRHVVIRDEAEWRTFWSEHNKGSSPELPVPPVDFSTSMLAGVVVAGLPNDCYFVYARRVLWAPSATSADHIELRFHVQPPGVGCVANHAPVSRMFLEAIPRSELPIVFVPVD